MNKEELKKLQEIQKENAERFKELENTFWKDYYDTKRLLDYAKNILNDDK